MSTPLAFLVYPLPIGFTAITYVGVQFIGLDLLRWLAAGGAASMVLGNL